MTAASPPRPGSPDRPDAGGTPPVRIGNMSGFYGDRATAMREMLLGGDLDYLTGDYLAELTMLILAKDRMKDPAGGYARSFLAQVDDSLGLIAERGVKVVANAGGLNPAGLAEALRERIAARGLDLTVAHVHGDDLTDRAAEFGFDGAIAANAYLGAFGIVACLDAGADIVVTGRVTDASVIVGPAAHHHGWGRGDLDRLAGAMAAGHVIECGTQATGGNNPFFDRPESGDLLRPGFPIAEIDAAGDAVITKHPGTGGAVTANTVTAQLLYEVTGARYPGPDATLRLDTVGVAEEGPDRVRLTGAVGEPAPPRLKVSVNRLGGYRNEVTLHVTGLAIEAKTALLERQLRALAPAPAELDIRVERTDHPDADTQAAASARVTVVAWDADRRVADAFPRAIVELALGTAPGVFLDAPPTRSSPYGVYTAGWVDQAAVPHIAVAPDGAETEIPAPAATAEVGPADTDLPLPADGRVPGEPTARVPLGLLFGARSGDKGGDANIGMWAEDDAAHAWLAHALDEGLLAELLPETRGLRIERHQLPRLRAVNFIVRGLLGHGVAHGARFDPQAKGLAEWLRSRHVDLPTRLLPDEARHPHTPSTTDPEETR